MSRGTGPLAGLRVLEIGSIGPAPFGCMMLADLGAEVILVERPEHDPFLEAVHSVVFRNRRRTVADLKSAEGVAVVLELVSEADVLVEGFRPGVAERLGIGPDVCHDLNPRLVYARMTGWGQDGPLAKTAGHDINYIARAGALGAFGPSNAAPVPPLNLLGDFGGGGMLLAFGIVSAVLEARRSGQGQVVDAAIVDGTAALLAMHSGMSARGLWGSPRGGNLFDGGAANYGVYECADGRHLAIGALEPEFYRQLLDGLGVDPTELPEVSDPRVTAELRARLQELIGRQPRAYWEKVFDGTDACVAPVLGLDEAVNDSHLAARRTWVEVDGVPQPAPAPRFSRTPADRPTRSDDVEPDISWGIGSAAVEPARR